MKKRSDLLVFGAIVTVLVLVVCTALLGSDPADNPEPGAAAGVQATVEARLVATLTPTSTAIRTDCDDERFVERDSQDVRGQSGPAGAAHTEGVLGRRGAGANR